MLSMGRARLGVGRRAAMMAVLVAMIWGLIMVTAGPAAADVTGGCDGSADFTNDSAGAYGPGNDTRSNPIVVSKAQGETVEWTGSVPGDNRNFGGDVEVRIGPTFFIVADWGFPNFDGANPDNEAADNGVYDMEEFWSVIPGGRNVVHGIYEARAIHGADGVDCVANFFVKFGGNALSSPVVIALLVLAAVLVALLILAGRERASFGRVKGRMVLAIIASLLLGLVVAALLQQFGIWPLDNLTVIVLPIIMLVVGIILAITAPFGGGGAPSEA